MGNGKAQNTFVGRWALSVALILALFGSALLLADEPVMKTLSAHVVRVAPDGQSIDVDFHNPATGKIEPLTFTLEKGSGLSKLKGLHELRSGQIVNIDYVEGHKHRLLIRRIARVKLSGPPAGLEKFRGL